MAKLHRTKIIATLGPACNTPETLSRLIAAGTDVVRINFSHGSTKEHQQLILLARHCAGQVGKEIAVIADLQGPKIRIARFIHHKITLHQKQHFTLDPDLDYEEGTQTSVGIEYKDLPKDVATGDILLLNDGLIELKVLEVVAHKIHCEVIVGGVLSNNKGINRKGGGLSARALTEKDKHDLEVAIKAEVDYVAISFPRNAQDIIEARNLIKSHAGHAGVIAKIERIEAVKNIDEIIMAADAVMVARGDLGVEIGVAEVPAAQKTIIHRARSLNRAVITATQMMESMIYNPIPTRAEVSDVANAVLDGTDAVMLSAETATGEHPISVVEAMLQICQAAERNPLTHISKHRIESMFHRVDEAIAMAAMYVANHLAIKAIITLTESGATPLWMSRIRSGIPIYALTRSKHTLRKMQLYRGVYPIHFDPTTIPRQLVNQHAIELLEKMQVVTAGDLIILTKGNSMGELGGTNAMKIIKVGEYC